jgi:hypothetical protein
MANRNLLDRVEARLESILEDPFSRGAPLDVKLLKQKMVLAVREVGTPYLPDRWYVRLPAQLKERDVEVRGWVDSLWRQLLAGLEKRDWPAGSRPSIRVEYDADLAPGSIMVGHETSRPGSDTGRLAVVPRRRSGVFTAVAKSVLLLLVLGVVAVAVLRPSAAAGLRDWRLSIPGLPPIGISSTRYLTTAEVRVRSEPTTAAPAIDTVPAGYLVNLGQHNLVRGQAIGDEDRWVDITDTQGWLTGQHRYIWFGVLKAAP